MHRVNRQTLGPLIKNTKRLADELSQLEPLLANALEERNRLAHSFYRQHNLRRNSDAGRAIMLKDLEPMHDTLLAAWKAVNLLSGIDLDALAERMTKARENSDGDAAGDDDLIVHLPI